MGYNLYLEHILDHYKNPRNYGKIEDFTVKHTDTNIPCGDELTYYLKIEDGKIKEVKFQGQGCVLSMASASILSDKVKNMDLKEIEGLGEEFIYDIMGIRPGPARRKCVLLSLKVLKKAMEKVDME